MGGLSASMWSSVSGLLAHGEKMGVISNNISNVSTVAFKGSRMDFADYMSTGIGTIAGTGQVGRGTRLGIVMGDFSNGSLETTTSATDIAISGNGWFKVRPQDSTMNYYTRAGNFLFNSDGYLTDPNGYVLQGWKIDRSSSQAATSSASGSGVGSSGIIGNGVPTDIRLDTFTCDPKHTNNVTTAVNLDSASGNNKCDNEDNPFFSLLTTWDATQLDSKGNIVALGTNSAAYSNSIEVFDEGGASHKLTVYYDRVEKTVLNDITGLEESEISWEYIVTMDPAEDKRDFDGDGITLKDSKSKYAGLLMAGTLNFNSSGQLDDMTAYVPNGGTDSDLGDLSTWVKAPMSSNGYPLLSPNFTGRTGASTAWDNTTPGSITAPTQVNKNNDGYLVEFNWGISSTQNSWTGNAPATIADWVKTPSPLTSPPISSEYKALKSDKAAGTLISGGTIGSYISGGSFQAASAGVVGSDGAVYRVKNTTDGDAAGANEVVGTDGIIYSQKNSSSDSIGTKEAAGVGGFIYEQSQTTVVIGGTSVTTEVFQDSLTSTQFVYHNGNTYDASTGAVYTLSAGATADKVPDATKPVASNRPVQTGDPILRRDSSGSPIPKTTSNNYSGLGTSKERNSLSTTSYTKATASGSNFYEHQNIQDGYTYGDLRSVNIDQDGVLSGTYSNGVSLELFQITLYDFSSQQNLRREGNNLFTETRESGLPTSGAPGSGVFGKTESYSLEGSNVDLSRELVQMITTQRGFQANSKGITTVDTMLETVIGMKR